jgi:biopolymer transport protein ExbB
MKRPLFRSLLIALALPLGLAAQDTADFDAKLLEVAESYTAKIEQAANDLNAARLRIAEEKVPQLNALRAAEDRILTLRVEVAREQMTAGNFEVDRARRQQEANAQNLNVSFLITSAAEGLTTWRNTAGSLGLRDQEQTIESLRARLDPNGGSLDVTASAETAEAILARVQAALGGQTLAGNAVSAEARELAAGKFVLLGPDTLFVSDDGATIGTVRTRDEGETPLVYALPEFDAASAAALVAGERTEIPLDVAGGKALQLRQSQGDWIDHINKGGIVGYVILGMGAFALLMAIMKLIDLRKLSVDAPSKTFALLEHVTTKGSVAAESLLEPLHATSRELFSTGLRHLSKPKAVIEEHLYAFILRERLQHERWLPMLAVIAAASPLLGLLGTVVGMVKTFTLITVFGTGNASKLSSGISEALVTTELGLNVAIPTLVLHGFLSYRTQKNLSLLERYAVEFVTASEDHKVTASS